MPAHPRAPADARYRSVAQQTVPARHRRDIGASRQGLRHGFFWAILMPTLIVCAGVVVRYAYAVASNKPLNVLDFSSLAVKPVVWAFLVSSIRFPAKV
jgi:hypothetical protein